METVATTVPCARVRVCVVACACVYMFTPDGVVVGDGGDDGAAAVEGHAVDAPPRERES